MNICSNKIIKVLISQDINISKIEECLFKLILNSEINSQCQYTQYFARILTSFKIDHGINSFCPSTAQGNYGRVVCPSDYSYASPSSTMASH